VTSVAVVLFILGAILTVAGAVFVFLGRFDDPPEKDAEELGVGDVLERLNHVVDRLEKRYRWGAVMMGLGIALIGAGACLAAVSVASAAPPPPPGP
jgi:hypothetical protein